MKVKFLKTFKVPKPSGEKQEYSEVIKKGTVREIPVLAAKNLIRNSIVEQID